MVQNYFSIMKQLPSLKFSLLAIFTLGFSVHQSGAALAFTTIDMLAIGAGNASVSQTGALTPGEFPFGSPTVFGNVPFIVTPSSGQLWSAHFANVNAGGASNAVVTQTFPLAVSDIFGFYTIASTYWGYTGMDTTQIRFNFSDSTNYSYTLVNGVDVRDFNSATTTYATTINGTTAREIYNDSTTTTRLDRQFYDLDAAGFGGKNLVSFTIIDSGATATSRIFLVGATAQTGQAGQAAVPEPSGLAMLGAGLGFLGMTRRRTRHAA